jgi:group I intron endonuclease
VNIFDKKSYIGYTIKLLEDRKEEHEKKPKKYRSYFQRVLAKYGNENFTWEVIDICFSKIEMENLEKKYIKLFNLRDSNIGYNIHEGGSGGDTISKNPNREKLNKENSQRQIGKKLSEEHKRKISIGGKKAKIGKKQIHTKETKKLLREAHLIHIDLKDFIDQFWINSSYKYLCEYFGVGTKVIYNRRKDLGLPFFYRVTNKERKDWFDNHIKEEFYARIPK